MIKERTVETHEGIQDRLTVHNFDRFQRRMRDRGWMETERIVKSGIDRGHALEVGSGPGYLGLEWLRITQHTRLSAVEISGEMIRRSRSNAEEYGLTDRAGYTAANAMHMPFETAAFDGVFSNGSLHEWEDPAVVFREIHRVLKPGGRFFISDLRRDCPRLICWLMKASAQGPAMKEGFMTSLGASYTRIEILGILQESPFSHYHVGATLFGIEIGGRKE